MRILAVHNRYLERGGEDTVFAAEVDLLQAHGHEVHVWVEDNAQLVNESQLKVSANAIWSRRSQRQMAEILSNQQPDIVHFHNTFLRISPAAYYACREVGVPVVQTLHNYRLICPAALLYRNGQVCESCMGDVGYWPGVVHGCWHDSRLQTAVVATMLTVHNWLDTWNNQVDIFIALSHFARSKFIQGGLNADKVVVKPNFLHQEQLDSTSSPAEVHETSNSALFVGRLSTEKGLDVLLTAWQQLPTYKLNIIGTGPLLEQVRAEIEQSQLPQVELWGQQERPRVMQFMRDTRFLVFTSQCYENFPMTILEAFASGTPVICSRIGSLPEIVEDGKSGLWFDPGNAQDLADKVRWAWENPQAMAAMGNYARQVFETKYSAEMNYRLLMSIYERAINSVA